MLLPRWLPRFSQRRSLLLDRRSLLFLARRGTSRSLSSSSWTIDALSGVVTSQRRDQGAAEAVAPEQGRFQSILGVEIHAQLDIPTKLFSSAPTRAVSASAPPNTAVHAYDAAVPGFLPSLSIEAVQAAVVTAHLLNCTIPTMSCFERKHYAYADLPHSYQITQQRWPLAVNGNVQCTYNNNNVQGAVAGQTNKKKNKAALQQQQQQQTLTCRINRIQLEQDSGKTIQVVNKSSSSGGRWRESRVDLNRAGQALVEIVSEPDLRTPHEAMALVEHVRQLFKHVGICNGRMEEGSLRCDLNVNLENMATGERSARVEVKNLNSLRQIIDAATYELHRHAQEWPMVEETRTWNVTTSQTELIRRKDQAEDYRFMPEPDLPPLVLDNNSSDSNYNDVFEGLGMEEFLAKRIPELPAQALERMVQEYGLTEYQARVITGDPPAIPFLDAAIATAKQKLDDNSKNNNQRQENRAVEMTTNFLINDLFGMVKEHSQVEAEASISESNVSPEQLGEIMAMILNGKISTTMAKNLLHLLYTKEHGQRPAEVAAAQGWQLVTDPTELRRLCEQVLEQHPDQLAMYHNNKDGKYEMKIFKFFTGQAMAASKGTAEPERLKDILRLALEEHRETKGDD